MKKNGFIATSILYSFFLVFITLFVALILNYLHNQVLIQRVNDDSWKMLQAINNTKISDLKIGDHIRFANQASIKCDLNVDAVQECFLNPNATWVVAYVETVGTGKKYYFLSDLDTHMLDVRFQLPNEYTPRPHAASIDIFNAIKAKNAYSTQLMFPGIRISIPTVSLLKKVRAMDASEDIKDAIFGTDGSYVVHMDVNTPGYVFNSYYYMRMYAFPFKEMPVEMNKQLEMIKNYCNGSFSSDAVSYNTNNPFGYIHTVRESATNTQYVDYCAYASPTAYTHYASDRVVDYDESNASDQIVATYASSYNLRVMADITVDPSANNTYIAGGKGTVIDPYLLTNGVKQS